MPFFARINCGQQLRALRTAKTLFRRGNISAKQENHSKLSELLSTYADNYHSKATAAQEVVYDGSTIITLGPDVCDNDI